jgi:phosphoribosyl-ATP pyrophosphohydrolase
MMVMIYQTIGNFMNNIINELLAVLQDRKANPNPNSYTSQLLTTGEDEILKKIGEEAVEVILAAKGQGDQRIIEETADLIYHTLVLLVSRDLTWDDALKELAKRRH